jgi:hypothetical protein
MVYVRARKHFYTKALKNGFILIIIINSPIVYDVIMIS